MVSLKLLIAMIALAITGNAIAQPRIDEVIGTPVAGGQLTLNGVGFGTKATPGPILYDTIDNIPQYASVVDGQDVPVRDVNDDDNYDQCPTCPWESFNYWGNRPRFETTPGNLRVPGRPVYFVSKNGYFRGPDPTASMNENDTAYLSWWYKANHALAYPPGGPVYNKLLRYTAGGGSNTWEEQVEVEPQLCYGTEDGCGDAGWDRFGEFYAERAANTWHHVEVIISGGGNLSAGTGRVDVTFDGVNVIPTSTLYSCHGMLDHIYIWGSDPHDPSIYPENSEIFFGEMYFDKTQARVVVVDSDQYNHSNASAVHWEIQEPISWFDGSITFEFNLGSFPSADGLYVYVFAPDGSISAPRALEGGPDVDGPGQSGQPILIN